MARTGHHSDTGRTDIDSGAPVHVYDMALHCSQPPVQEGSEVIGPCDVPRSLEAHKEPASPSTSRLNVIYQEFGDKNKDFNNPLSLEDLRGKFQAHAAPSTLVGVRGSTTTVPWGNEAMITMEELMKRGRDRKKVLVSRQEEADR